VHEADRIYSILDRARKQFHIDAQPVNPAEEEQIEDVS